MRAATAAAAVLLASAVLLVRWPRGDLSRVRVNGPVLARPDARRLLGRLPSPRGRREASAGRRAVVELCDALAAELAAGATPARALAASLEAAAVPPRLAAAIRVAAAEAAAGGDVAAALRRAADEPGGEGLAAVAACWSVAVGRGAGLGPALELVGEALRADEALRRQVRAELAAPRATARVLAALPLAGVGLGAALGARPVELLLGTGWGRACLVAGLVLTVLGITWVDRLAAVAEAGR